MIRFTLRQFRTQGVVAVGALTIVAIVALITGLHLVHLYDTTVGDCARYDDCSTASSTFLLNDLPLLGMLANDLRSGGARSDRDLLGRPTGGPRARSGDLPAGLDPERDPDPLAGRKLGVVGLASMATAGLLSLMVTWWSSPIDRVNLNVFSNFDQRDIAPIGYAAFAFALGTTAGVLIRRTVPAMAATLVGFVTTQLLVYHFASAVDHLPMATDLPAGVGLYGVRLRPNQPGSTQPVRRFAGHLERLDLLDQYRRQGRAGSHRWLSPACLSTARFEPRWFRSSCSQLQRWWRRRSGPCARGAMAVLKNCVVKVGATYHEVVTYQPPGHYWPLQWIVLGIYLAAALALAGLSYGWVRRRRA